jgi:hypothetical protein
MRPVAFVAGLAVVGALAAGFLWWTRGAHMELRGEVKKVRTHAIEDGSSLAVIDFRSYNPADYPFVVRSVDLFLEEPDGKSIRGSVIAETDARRVFEALPHLGQKYNDTLKIRDKIGPHQEEDRMVSARFELPESALQARKGFRIRVEEVDGVVSEIVEQRR